MRSFLLRSYKMSGGSPDRVLEKQAIVKAAVSQAWEAWTTEEGIRSFFAPACNVDLRVDDPFEVLFDPEAAPGKRGAEGCRILAFQPEKMLALTWNAPPHLAEVRKQWTHPGSLSGMMDGERVADGTRLSTTSTRPGIL